MIRTPKQILKISRTPAVKEVTLDAAGKSLGRVASEAAVILQGKKAARYERHLMTGPNLKVINIAKAKFTGGKYDSKIYYRHTGYIGHLKEEKFSFLFEKDPKKVFRKMVSGMLPKNSHRPKLLNRMRIEI